MLHFFVALCVMIREMPGTTLLYSTIAHTYGIKTIIVLINKMDEKGADFGEVRFNLVQRRVRESLVNKFSYKARNIVCIPVCGINGDNLYHKSKNEKLLKWYKGWNLYINKTLKKGDTLYDVFKLFQKQDDRKAVKAFKWKVPKVQKIDKKHLIKYSLHRKFQFMILNTYNNDNNAENEKNKDKEEKKNENKEKDNSENGNVFDFGGYITQGTIKPGDSVRLFGTAFDITDPNGKDDKKEEKKEKEEKGKENRHIILRGKVKNLRYLRNFDKNDESSHNNLYIKRGFAGDLLLMRIEFDCNDEIKDLSNVNFDGNILYREDQLRDKKRLRKPGSVKDNKPKNTFSYEGKEYPIPSISTTKYYTDYGFGDYFDFKNADSRMKISDDEDEKKKEEEKGKENQNAENKDKEKGKEKENEKEKEKEKEKAKENEKKEKEKDEKAKLAERTLESVENAIPRKVESFRALVCIIMLFIEWEYKNIRAVFVLFLQLDWLLQILGTNATLCD